MLRLAGDACAGDDWCFSGKCNNSVCLALAEGQDCAGSDCAQGLFCNRGVCTKSLPVGSDCTAEFLQFYAKRQSQISLADIQTICNASTCVVKSDGSNATCIAPFANAEGGKCGIDLFGLNGVSFACAPPLVCGLDDLCASASSTSCDDSDQCESFFTTCTCSNATTGTCKLDSCTDKNSEMFACAIEKNIGVLSVYAALIPGTRASQCVAQIKAAECCNWGNETLYGDLFQCSSASTSHTQSGSNNSTQTATQSTHSSTQHTTPATPTQDDSSSSAGFVISCSAVVAVISAVVLRVL